MHILQPKFSKLNDKDSSEFLNRLNISKAQLPKILSSDPSLPKDCNVGDIIKFERNTQTKTETYFRVVV